MLNHVLFVDIETVPDRALIPPGQTTFPKPIHHRVVAISFLEARIERESPDRHLQRKRLRPAGPTNPRHDVRAFCGGLVQQR
jgi:hypothetical protein